tara:strand:+ start:79383 stop:79508 length:126 start_codon:yes stop_codon:yes gene_type:complete
MRYSSNASKSRPAKFHIDYILLLAVPINAIEYSAIRSGITQ